MVVVHTPPALRAIAALVALLLGACQQLPEPQGIDSTGTSGATGPAASTSGPPPEPTADCDPGLQDCPEGEKCTAVAQGGGRSHYTCVSDTDTLPEGEACIRSLDGEDGCTPGTLCVEDRLGNGRCLGVCIDHGDCQGGRCLSAPFDDVRYCASQCDPLASTCPPNMACAASVDRFLCQFPYEEDMGVAGEACDPFADRGCLPGLACLQGTLVPGCGDVGCCTTFCNTNDPNAQAECQAALGTAGVACVPFFSGAAPGYEHVGVCIVPA